MHLVYVADENFAMQLAASVRSVLDHTPNAREELRLTVVTSGLREETRERLRRSWDLPVGRVRFHELPAGQLDALPPTPRRSISQATYARLLLPELLDSNSGRVLYLDCDVIATRDIRPLWSIPLGGMPLAAALDLGIPALGGDGGVGRWRDLGLDPEAAYFNAGVLLIDLDRIRDGHHFEYALDYLADSQNDVRWADQEALNAALNGRFTQLDPIWNVTFHWYTRTETAEARRVHREMRIRHFAGYIKPWSSDVRTDEEHRRNHGAELFYASVDQTAWSGWRPSGQPTATA